MRIVNEVSLCDNSFGGRASRMTSFAQFFNDLRREGAQVTRIATGDKPIVSDDLPVEPASAGVFDILTNRYVGRGAATFGRIGLNEQLRSMADGRDDFAGHEKFVDHAHCIYIDTEYVGF